MTAALGVPAAAHAYVPPSQFIIKTWVGKRQGAKVVKIRSTLTAIEDGRPTSARVKVTTVFNATTRNLKSWVTDDQDRKLYGVERARRNLPAVGALLLDSEVREVSHALRAASIPLRTDDELLAMKDEEERRAAEEMDFTRWKSGFAWVIGPSEGFDPQLWFEKDTFLPLRMVLGTRSAGVVDVRFENYRYQHDYPYPRVVSVLSKDSVELIRDELVEVQVNPDAAALKLPSGTMASGFTDEGNSAPSAVRDLILKYYDIVR